MRLYEQAHPTRIMLTERRQPDHARRPLHAVDVSIGINVIGYNLTMADPAGLANRRKRDGVGGELLASPKTSWCTASFYALATAATATPQLYSDLQTITRRAQRQRSRARALTTSFYTTGTTTNSTGSPR